MVESRIIPCLLLFDGGLVKTTKFSSPKYVGDPINVVRIFNEKEVDELIFIDIEATRNKRAPNLTVIKELASECFMPFAYGGGITTLDQIRDILKVGVEKVILNHIILSNPDFVTEACKYFGSSTIVGAMDVKRDFWGHLKVYDHIKKKTINQDPNTYAKKLESLGVGEIFINDVDRDGTFKGLDIETISSINKTLTTPVVACGGASDLANIKDLIRTSGVSGVAAGSLFVYQGPHRAVLVSYPSRNQIKDILSNNF
ncbi:MAG: AglZ/HisF2 family acetamidino modification protein [Cyclobacteriaceae bacterium]|nr:AglZ/HisF2 family acetamidino modification protein [Cyclobacteriaceae bacterium]